MCCVHAKLPPPHAFVGGRNRVQLLRRPLRRRLLPALAQRSERFWSKLATHSRHGIPLEAPPRSDWPFHSWFELQRLHFEGRLGRAKFERLRTQAVSDHPNDPLEQKKQLFDALQMSGATKNYATAPRETREQRLKSFPIDQVLHYRAHLHSHTVRSGRSRCKDIRLTLEEPLWTGNRRLFRRFGSDRFLHITFDKLLLTCSQFTGCTNMSFRNDTGAVTVGYGCKKCQARQDYLAWQLVGRQTDTESTRVVLSLAGF